MLFPLAFAQSPLAQISTSFSTPVSNFAAFGRTPYFITAYLTLTFVATAALILAVTVGIRRDALRLRAIGAGTLFFGPFGWAVVAFCASLLGGVMGAVSIIAAYWLIHHSTLRRDRLPCAVSRPD